MNVWKLMPALIKSIAFCLGWIIAASIGLWAMAIYGSFFAIKEMR